MAKIYDLPLIDAPDGSETVPVVRGNVTYRARLAGLMAGAVTAAIGDIAKVIKANTSQPGRLFEFVDARENITGYMTDDATLVMRRARARDGFLIGMGQRAIGRPYGAATALELADSDGRTFVRARDGLLKVSRLKTETINGDSVARIKLLLNSESIYLGDVTREILLIYGQSLSIGGGSSNGAGGPAVVVTTDQPYGNLSFPGGPVIGRPSGEDLSALVPHIEQVVSVSNGETIAGGFQAMLMQLLHAHGLAPHQHRLRTIAMAPGQGETPIAGLRAGTGVFNRLKRSMKAAKDLSPGEVVAARAAFWLQSESDGTNPRYPLDLGGMAIEIKTAIREILDGRTDPFTLFTYQVDRARSSQWFVDAEELSDLIRVFAPIYWVQVNGLVGANFDDVHRSARGSQQLGAAAAIAWFCHVVLKRPWRALQLGTNARGLLRSYRQGADLILPYDVPHGGTLKFDDGQFARMQRGFYLFGANGAEKRARDVVIEGRERIRMIGVNPAAGDSLRIGYKDPDDYSPQSASVNLRDCQGDFIRFDDGGGVPIHNWALCQRRVLTAAEVA